jgi:auxin efflux carrier family protein
VDWNYAVVVGRHGAPGPHIPTDCLTVYAIACYSISLGLGVTLTKTLSLAAWLTPAIAFYNTSYPLLLIQSLDATDIFSRLIVTDEKSSEAIDLAKSYFLIFATIGTA